MFFFFADGLEHPFGSLTCFGLCLILLGAHWPSLDMCVMCSRGHIVWESAPGIRRSFLSHIGPTARARSGRNKFDVLFISDKRFHTTDSTEYINPGCSAKTLATSTSIGTIITSTTTTRRDHYFACLGPCPGQEIWTSSSGLSRCDQHGHCGGVQFSFVMLNPILVN